MHQNLRNLALAGLLSVLILSSIFVVLEVMMTPTPSNAQGNPTPNPFQVSHADLVATSQAQAAQGPGVVEEMPYPGQPDIKGGSGASTSASAPLTLEQVWALLQTRWQSLINIFKSMGR